MFKQEKYAPLAHTMSHETDSSAYSVAPCRISDNWYGPPASATGLDYLPLQGSYVDTGKEMKTYINMMRP